MNVPRQRRTILILVVALLFSPLTPRPAHTASNLEVVISEIAWMGTTMSHADEWIELYNNSGSGVDLAGWTLSAADGTPSIDLGGAIPAGGHYLLERTDDTTVPGVAADAFYSGALGNEGEQLFLRDDVGALVDEVDCAAGWYAGHDVARVPMVRVDVRLPGTQASNWTHNPRCGSATNAAGAVYECLAAVAVLGYPLPHAVYYNERATTASVPCLAAGCSANVTLAPTAMETALLGLIDGAMSRIDAAIYGLNRASIVDALIAAHQRGVAVRVIGDDAAAAGPYSAHYGQLASAGITVTVDTDPDKIQHNKFLVFDAQVTWTGSTNLTDTGLTLNANNSLVLTDTVLAGNYVAEFEEMWAGSFDGAKVVNTLQHLDYANLSLESYFSPTDLPAFEVWSELSKAEETIHFAMFGWTDALLSMRVAERLAAGVEVYGVWDQLMAGMASSQDDMLCAAGARIGIEDLPGKLHHKFAVLDVAGDDPVVVLGSYNWTAAGAYENDENTLIVHDRALAEAYYAEWQRLWGTVPPERICRRYAVYLPLVVRGGE